MNYFFRENDIVCGHSPTYRLQPGNVWLRERVLAAYDRYERSTKLEQTRLSEMIVDEVTLRRQGRFLISIHSNVWEQLTYLGARDKVASMFRSERKRRRREAEQLDVLIESMYDPSNDDELFQMIQNDIDYQTMVDSLCENDPDSQVWLVPFYDN